MVPHIIKDLGEAYLQSLFHTIPSACDVEHPMSYGPAVHARPVF